MQTACGMSGPCTGRENDDADALVPEKPASVGLARYLSRENLGGNLEIYKNTACLTWENEDCFGTSTSEGRHAAGGSCSRLSDMMPGYDLATGEPGELHQEERADFYDVGKNLQIWFLYAARKRARGWSKEFREMDERKLAGNQ